MLTPIKHEKASKHKKSRRLKLNVSMHPFVLAAILSALTMLVVVIALYYFRFLK